MDVHRKSFCIPQYSACVIISGKRSSVCVCIVRLCSKDTKNHRGILNLTIVGGVVIGCVSLKLFRVYCRYSKRVSLGEVELRFSLWGKEPLNGVEVGEGGTHHVELNSRCHRELVI